MQGGQEVVGCIKTIVQNTIQVTYIVTYNGFHEEACWDSVHDGTYYFVQPRTCNYVNQCAAQYPEGILNHY